MQLLNNKSSALIDRHPHKFPHDLGNPPPAKDESVSTSFRKRRPSLTFSERVFLSALLIDHDERDDRIAAAVTTTTTDETTIDNSLQKELSANMLFSLPVTQDNVPVWNDESTRSLALTLSPELSTSVADHHRNASDDESEATVNPAILPTPPRVQHSTVNQIGLWKAHEDGLTPKILRKMSSRCSRSRASSYASYQKKDSLLEGEDIESSDDDGESSSEEDSDSVLSDEEVRGARFDDNSASSWGLSEGGFDHYDTWGVLKDEYAQDFGFGYADGGTQLDDSDDEAIHFRILGTSVDDVASHPHVLSPPLMESILNFVPDTLSQQNFWMKFSLVRDGASLQTLKRYVRAAKYTVLAIETTNGEVFGCFTGSPWRLNKGYYGSGEAFLWRMRHSRMTPCHSMLEQAQMESEIDVYFYSGMNTYVQLCMSDRIAVGGGKLDTSGQERHGDDVPPNAYLLEEGENYGFGLAINSDLLHGTSSPCATFRNPCLSNRGSKGDVFEIVNLEVWTFTPCENVKDAEQLEFVTWNLMSQLSKASSAESDRFPNSKVKSERSWETMSQENFYRRVGERDEDRYHFGVDPLVGSTRINALMS